VIDATDGSGKATQIRLREKRLKGGKKVESSRISRIRQKNFFGSFIGHLLLSI